MHGQLKEFLVVLTVFPSVLVHFLAEAVEGVVEQRVGVGIGELASLLGGEVHKLLIDGAWYLSALAENHSPHGVVHHDETALALLHGEEVHKGYILHIL